MWLIRHGRQKLTVVYNKSQIFSLGDQENVDANDCGLWTQMEGCIKRGYSYIILNLGASEISN